MNNKPELEQKILQTLDSLDGIQRAEPRPYFYTRLRARLERSERTVWETLGQVLSRPVVAVAGLCLILVFNAVMLLRQDSEPASASQAAGTIEQLVTDNEYILASSSSYEYENLDQQ